MTYMPSLSRDVTLGDAGTIPLASRIANGGYKPGHDPEVHHREVRASKGEGI